MTAGKMAVVDAPGDYVSQIPLVAHPVVYRASREVLSGRFCKGPMLLGILELSRKAPTADDLPRT